MAPTCGNRAIIFFHEKNFFGKAFFLKERLKGGENKIMAEIVIRTGKPESIMPVLDSAIRNQLKLLKTSINRTKKRISSFEQKYDMSTEQFMQKIREGMDDDNLGNYACEEVIKEA